MVNKNKNLSTENSELARVGTQPDDVPAGRIQKKGLRRLFTRDAPAKNGEDSPESEVERDKDGSPSSGGWHPSASEQIEQFKGLPIVGSLPWRVQYLTLATILALSMVVVVAGILSSKVTAPVGAQQHGDLSSLVRTEAVGALSGNPINADAIESALSASAAHTGSATIEDYRKDVEAWLEIEARWNEVSAQAQSVADRLSEGAFQASSLWSEIRQEGFETRPEAVRLARLIGAYESLSARMKGIASGHSRLLSTQVDRVAIVDLFRDFRASPLATQPSALNRAWRAASAAWAQSAVSLEALTDENVKQIAADRQAILSRLMASDGHLSGQVESGTGPATKTAAILAIVSLALLLGVAWKQQRWHVLNARLVSEQVDQAVSAMIADLSPVGQGDLTRRARVSELPIGVLAKTMNKALDDLRHLVRVSKQTTSETSAASRSANEATAILVNRQRIRLEELDEGGQAILRMIESVGAGATDAETSKELTDKAMESVEAGRKAVVESIDRIRDTQERVDEATSRAQRLVDSSNEIAEIALVMKEIAEQLEILGMQADLQASKAGEAGQGFRVVAKEVQSLSEDSGARARNVSSLVETALSDLEALMASMGGASGSVQEGARLADDIHSAWTQVGDDLEKLSSCVNSLYGSAEEQKELASFLDERTRKELGQVDEEAKSTKEAAEATRRLLVSVEALNEAVSKFKA